MKNTLKHWLPCEKAYSVKVEYDETRSTINNTEFHLLYSSSMVEQTAVNRQVVGSSPTCTATNESEVGSKLDKLGDGPGIPRRAYHPRRFKSYHSHLIWRISLSGKALVL